jgi:DNA-binding Lrp family transcriptional regulator
MVRAYVLISTSPGKAIDVVSKMSGQDGILQADAITGEYDSIALNEAQDVAGIGSLIVEKIQRIEGVFKTVTCLAVQ